MNWLHYLLEANLYLGVFYLGYYLFLSRETYYTLNRVYLLFSCIASFALPVLQLGILKPAEQPVTAVNFAFTTSPNTFTPVAAPVEATPLFTWQDALVDGYVLGAAILLVVLLVKLYSLYKLTHSQNPGADGKYKLVYIDQSATAFSFFNYLFIGTKVEGSETIIRHELVHIRQKHSFDIIFIELLKIVNWFNPFIYLLQYSLKTIHEYIADEKTAIAENDALAYSSFLVNNAYGLAGSSITHSFFNYNLLKKRIIMLHQKRSGSLARLKYLVAVPICAGLLCASTLAFSKDYGWVDIVPAVSSPATTMNTDGTAPNRVGYVIDPSSLSDKTLNTFADKFRSKGYKMLYKKYNDRDNGGALIDISLQSLYSEPDGKATTSSATFRIAELKRTGYIIFVGADKDRRLVFVHSDTKDLSMQKEIEAYHLGPHRIDKTNTSPQVLEPNRELLVHRDGKSTITDKFSYVRPDGTTRIYTAYNLSNKDKVDLAKKGIEIDVLQNVKLDNADPKNMTSVSTEDTAKAIVKPDGRIAPKSQIAPPVIKPDGRVAPKSTIAPPAIVPDGQKGKIAPPPPPAPPVTYTKKGYKYREDGYAINGKTDFRVVITLKNGDEKEFFRSKASAADLKLLKDKYGYVFPTMEIYTKLPPPPPAAPAPAAPKHAALVPQVSPDFHHLVYTANNAVQTTDDLAPAPAIVVNGAIYKLDAPLKKGQQILVDASGGEYAVMYTDKDLADAVAKYGPDAKNGVIFATGKTTVTIKPADPPKTGMVTPKVKLIKAKEPVLQVDSDALGRLDMMVVVRKKAC